MGFEIVVIGTSLGGLKALETVLSGLGGEFPLPVVAVQHRERDSRERLCDLLQGHAPLPVGPAGDKEEIVPGRVYIAPPGYHVMVEANGQERRFALSTDEPVLHSRPSIDVLFESAADAYGSGVVGVVLTGASEDGARGVARVKECGGCVVVQDPATADGPAMPRAAMVACEVDLVLPLAKIGPFLSEELHMAKGETVGC